MGANTTEPEEMGQDPQKGLIIGIQEAFTTQHVDDYDLRISVILRQLAFGTSTGPVTSGLQSSMGHYGTWTEPKATTRVNCPPSPVTPHMGHTWTTSLHHP